MFIPEPNIELSAPGEAASSRGRDAVLLLVGVGIVVLVALAMLSAGTRASRVMHPGTPALSNYPVSHVRLGR
jgi:hypothetical protein